MKKYLARNSPLSIVYCLLAMAVLLVSCSSHSIFPGIDRPRMERGPGIIGLPGSTTNDSGPGIVAPTPGSASSHATLAIATNLTADATNRVKQLAQEIIPFRTSLFSTNGNFVRTNIFLPSGTNDRTAEIQAAINAGGDIDFPMGGIFKIRSGLRIGTNPFAMYGHCMTYFQFPTNLVGFGLDFTTNASRIRPVINGIAFCGPCASYDGTAGQYPLIFAAGLDPCFQPTLTNQSAIRVDRAAGGEITACIFSGWPGFGMLSLNHDGTSLSFLREKTDIHHNFFASNFISFLAVQAQNHVAGVYNSDSSTWANFFDTYGNFDHNQIMCSALGGASGGGNFIADANFVNGNDVGWNMRRGGRFQGGSLNHNNSWGMIFTDAQGGNLVGTEMLATPGILILGDSQVSIRGCSFAGSPFKLVGTNSPATRVTCSYNGYFGVFNTDFTTNWSGDPATNIMMFGNSSLDHSGDNDGAPLTILQQGKWLILQNQTNLPSAAQVGAGGTAFGSSNGVPFRVGSPNGSSATTNAL